MCTSIAMNTEDFYFGRTMDIEYSFNENVVFTPRNYPIPFRRNGTLRRHYALLGMASVMEGYPLYAEADFVAVRQMRLRYRCKTAYGIHASNQYSL